MQNLLRNFKIEKQEYLILSILLITYIVLPIHLPGVLSDIINSIFGRSILYIGAFYILFKLCKVSGLLALVAAYIMIYRASLSTGTYAIQEYLPSEERKVMDFNKFNEYPITLEEEEVARMAPVIRNDTSVGSDYKPVLDSLHSAAPTDYDGVI